jgi:hypothetical protein
MATAAGESPTTTNGFCSPAFDITGIEQRVAIALTATRLRRTGGIDITLSPREDGRVVRLRVIAMEGFGRGEVRYNWFTLRPVFPFFMSKTSGAPPAKVISNQCVSIQYRGG